MRGEGERVSGGGEKRKRERWRGRERALTFQSEDCRTRCIPSDTPTCWQLVLDIMHTFLSTLVEVKDILCEGCHAWNSGSCIWGKIQCGL